MFTGNTIDELFGMVEKVEAQAETVVMTRELKKQVSSAFNVYGIEQFKNYQREAKLMGVA